ncbi:hypothetical protein [Streptomyces sp. NRRL S-481]|uniref:hypothetical protein n=1 Tax=Streptomyces sp. NRRL S-481 TaxID=1463911 RepID=UPI0004C6A736|nr:hypothetical protein [Streptomyces sp. NRRL S-481]
MAAASDRDGHLYALDDRSGNRGAGDWGRETCLLAIELRADAIVVESNYGGMSRQILQQAWQELQGEKRTENMLMPAVLTVTAKVGKRLRAEPIAQLYEQGRVHHAGEWPVLKQHMVTWVAGMDSPDRTDRRASVHAVGRPSADRCHVLRATGDRQAVFAVGEVARLGVTVQHCGGEGVAAACLQLRILEPSGVKSPVGSRVVEGG